MRVSSRPVAALVVVLAVLIFAAAAVMAARCAPGFGQAAGLVAAWACLPAPVAAGIALRRLGGRARLQVVALGLAAGGLVQIWFTWSALAGRMMPPFGGWSPAPRPEPFIELLALFAPLYVGVPLALALLAAALRTDAEEP